MHCFSHGWWVAPLSSQEGQVVMTKKLPPESEFQPTAARFSPGVLWKALADTGAFLPRLYRVNVVNMKNQSTRPYRMQARAEAVEETANSILDAATTAFGSTRFADVTLREIAEAADVSVQTVIRRFGSKEGLFDAVVDKERTRIAARRQVPAGADLRRRIEILVDHYEEDGDVVLHLLSEEDRSPEVALVVAEGRRTHRTWVETQLLEILGHARGPDHRRLVDGAVAATDLLTWKLLRRDVGRNQKEVIEVMVRMLEGLRKETP